MLDEGPLDFVGRFWEKVKPRDTAVVVSEHVGEIKKPNPDEEPRAVTPQVIQEKVQEKSKEVVQNIRGTLGPLWQRAGGLMERAQGELQGRIAAHAKQRQRAA